MLDQGSNNGEFEAADFWGYLPGKVTAMGMFKKTLNVREADGLDSKVKRFTPVLFRLADDMPGEIKKEATAKPVVVSPTESEFPRIRRTDLQHKHGYLFDTGFHVYIWLGIYAARETVITATTQSNAYFRKYRRPLLPVTILKVVQETVSFNTHFFEQEEELDELKARLDEQIKRNATLRREVSDLRDRLRQSRIPGRRYRPCGRHGPLRQGAGGRELILINFSKNYS